MNKGRRSAWYPYLMQLPRSYDTLASFGAFEANALQVDDAIWVTEKVMSKTEFDWKEAIGLLKQLELKPQFVTSKAWLWASATISSRTLHVPWDSAGCLCPVGDFFNYAPPEELAATEVSKSCIEDSLLQIRSFKSGDNTEDSILDGEQCDACSGRLTDGGYEEELAAYCFYAKKHYQSGEQVLLSYGTYSNLELLEHYGFLLDENPNDKVYIPLEHDIFTCHSWPTDSMYIQHNGKPSFSLLSALRLWAAPPKQRKSIGYHALCGSQLSPENDLIVLKWLSSSCRAILNNLPSTIEDDKLLLTAIDEAQQLQSDDMPSYLPCVAAIEFCSFLESIALLSKVKKSLDKWKLAVQWRLRYKKTLSNCISYCSQTIEILSSEKGAK
ncbi:Protein SET DOMAIN GROUP 40 [Bienertia sinuspersici]